MGHEAAESASQAVYSVDSEGPAGAPRGAAGAYLPKQLLIATVVAAMLLSACGSANSNPSAVGGPVRTASPTIAPTTLSSPRSTDAPPGSPGGDASITADDAAGDLTDLDGASVGGPAYIDAVRIAVNIDGADAQFILTLAQSPPPGIDGSVEQINYLVIIDTDAAEDWDYWLSAENRSSGEYAFVLTDWSDAYSYDSENNEFPGAGVVGDELVIMRVPLEALGSPESMRVAVWTQKSEDFDVVAEDYVPDAAADLRADAGWIVVRP